MSKYGVISGPNFSVFSPNTGKHGPEITPYLDTFHAVKYMTLLPNATKIHLILTMPNINLLRTANYVKNKFHNFLDSNSGFKNDHIGEIEMLYLSL